MRSIFWMLIVVLTSLFASLSFSKSGFVLAESIENQEENEGEEVEEIFEIREVLSKHTIKETKDPDGVGVRRVVGKEIVDYDPFINLVDNVFQKSSSFEPQPHRGFDIVTYVLQGSIFYEDAKGNLGIINEGDLQWLTAGKMKFINENHQIN